jgi:hypothetical protein
MAPSDKPKYLKISFYLKRREDCSEEKFSQYWRNNHAPLALQTKVFTEKVRRYNQVCASSLCIICTNGEQVHNSKELKAQAAAFGLPVLDFDGVAEIWVDSLEDWMEVVSDTNFMAAVAGEFVPEPEDSST